MIFGGLGAQRRRDLHRAGQATLKPGYGEYDPLVPITFAGGTLPCWPDRPRYEQLVERPWFPTALVVVFAAFALGTLVEAIIGARRIWNGSEHLHIITLAGLVSSLVASGMVWVGILRLRDSRIEAYRWFDHALIIQVFFTEVFAFLQNQFGAVFGLLLNLALLVTLRTMIHAECRIALLSDDPFDTAAVPA